MSFLTTHRLPAQLPIHHALVVLYLSYLAHHGTLMATIDRRLAAIRFIHEQARTVSQLDEEVLSPTEHPMVRRTRRNLARRLGTAPENRRKVLYTEDIQRILTTLPDTPIGARHRALLLVGFAGGFRRSELVGINIEDIGDRPNGIAIHLPRSKTDQHGRGRSVGILHGEDPATCPVTALKAWLTAASITTGPVFRAVDRHGNVASEQLSAGSVARIVKRAAQQAGLNPQGSYRQGSTVQSDSGALGATYVFGGGKQQITSQRFSGGSVTAVFGSAQIDLRDASFADGRAVIDLTVLFDGVKLRIPDGWAVDAQSTHLLSGVQDEHIRSAQSPGGERLTITGLCIGSATTPGPVPYSVEMDPSVVSRVSSRCSQPPRPLSPNGSRQS